jgi:peptidoglycan hydrolase-like protein with peptidoglycan-binding domain
MFLWALSVFSLALWGLAQAGMPLPFTRELYVTSPVMTGNDVLIAQTLLQRDDAVDKSFVASGKYADDSAKATAAFQTAHNLPSTGILDSVSAQTLLDLHSDDGYTDSGFTAASMGYLYKIHIPVHTNRSVETYSTLFDKDNNVLLKFKTRTHGHRADGTDVPWPDYGNGDIGLTQFYSNGTYA